MRVAVYACAKGRYGDEGDEGGGAIKRRLCERGNAERERRWERWGGGEGGDGGGGGREGEREDI